MVQSFFLWIRRRETPQSDLMYRVAFKLLRLSIPTPKLFFQFIYYARTIALAICSHLSRVFYYDPLFRSRCVDCGSNLLLYLGLPYIYGHVRLYVGDNCKINGRSAFASSKVFDSPEIRLGDNTNIGFGVVISAAKSVTIGNNVRIADGCLLMDNSGHPVCAQARRRNDPVARKDVHSIRIEDDVWLGSRVTVLPGVTVGARSIIGSGSVVTRSIPSDSLAVGNPARVIRSLLPKNQNQDNLQ